MFGWKAKTEREKQGLLFRSELKHTINRSDYLALKQRLNAVAQRDTHAEDNGAYHIRSLYFDSPDDKALREKLDGINQREKFRIRYYNWDPSYIRLEKKSKRNGVGNKQYAPMTQEQCEQLIAGEIGWMLDSRLPLLVELYGKIKFQQLRPRTIVDYTREAYLFPAGNVRVTLDSNIRTGLQSLDFFNPDLPTVPTGHPDKMILEVKFDDFLPEIMRDVVQTKERRSAAFSKYAVCRMYA